MEDSKSCHKNDSTTTGLKVVFKTYCCGVRFLSSVVGYDVVKVSFGFGISLAVSAVSASPSLKRGSAVLDTLLRLLKRHFCFNGDATHINRLKDQCTSWGSRIQVGVCGVVI